jgi:hypothetical protein
VFEGASSSPPWWAMFSVRSAVQSVLDALAGEVAASMEATIAAPAAALAIFAPTPASLGSAELRVVGCAARAATSIVPVAANTATGTRAGMPA